MRLIDPKESAPYMRHIAVSDRLFYINDKHPSIVSTVWIHKFDIPTSTTDSVYKTTPLHII